MKSSASCYVDRVSCICVVVLVTAGLFISSIGLAQYEDQNIAFVISSNEEDQHFKSLETVEQILDERNSTGSSIGIVIATPVLNLTSRTEFSDQHSLFIVGSNESTTILCNYTNAGIVFANITSVRLIKLKFTSCGTPVKVHHTSYISAVTLLSCKTIEIRDVTVYKSNGVGLMVLKHQGNNISVVSSTFEENNVTSERELGGGGVYIGSFVAQDIGQLSIEFSNCTFKRNKAHTRHYRHIFTDNVGRNLTGYGRGGGLFLAFEQKAMSTNVSAKITDSMFIENTAFIGSGLSIKIRVGYQQVVEVIIRNTSFESNGYKRKEKLYAGLGGGIQLDFNSYNESIISNNIVTMQNVNFTKNYAQHGGGVFIYSHKQVSTTTSKSLLFSKCVFKENRAVTGSAVDISPNVYKRLFPGYTIVPTFINCKFLENRVYVNTKTYTSGLQRNAGIGTLYASLCDLNFEGYTLFKRNKGTAIHIVNSNAYFHNGSARFESNAGIEGGALALIGVSSIVVGPNNTYEFINNKALYRGGGVFVQLIGNHDFSLSRSCFIQYRDRRDGYIPLLESTWNTNITFEMNSAKRGQSIYATSIFPCQTVNYASNQDQRNNYVRVDISKAFEKWGISLDNERSITEHIATDGDRISSEVPQMIHKFIPGHYGEHGVQVFDDLGTGVFEPLRTEISNVGEVQLDETSLFVLRKVRLLGKPGSKASLILSTASSRQSYISLCVELLECPPGFRIQNEKCECDASSYAGITGCSNSHSYLLPSFWVGMVQDEIMPNVSLLVTSSCPLSYCYTPSDSTKTLLPESHDDLEELICGSNNRKGVVCGSCKENYTVYFHSLDNDCREEYLCHIGYLFYIVSELIPVTIVFVTVVVLNISFTSGAVNGFILFSQLLVSLNIDASGLIQLPESIQGVKSGYTIIYGFFNLDFFRGYSTSFCLWKGASALDVVAFKYVTIAYALLLVMSVIVFINKCGGQCLGRWYRITTIKSSLIHGISTFLIICYSQAVQTSLYLVNGHELQHNILHYSQSNFTLSKRVWLDSNLKYFGKEHLRYAVPAIIILITTGILPLMLMYPLLSKLLDMLKVGDSKPAVFIFRWIIPINSLKPLLDCFQGCFKDNMRFFSGFYFLYRWSALVAFTAASNFSGAYIATLACFTVFLMVHSLCQPYLNMAHNVIDTLLFADLMLINFISFVHYVIFRNEESRYLYESEVKNSATFQMVLIYVPLAIFVLYVLIQGYTQISSWCSNRKFRKSHNDDNPNAAGVALKSFRTLVRSITSSDPQSDHDDLPHRLISDASECEVTKFTGYGYYKNADAIVTY